MNDSQVEEFLKSQLRNGQYTPANKLTELGREKQLVHVKYGGGAGKFKGNQDPLKGRGISSVYAGHAVDRGIADAVKSPTRASKVHRNVEFGHTVSPELEHVIDRGLDPKLVGQAKHKIVYHHGAADDNIVAGATGAHVTTGGKAHVVINQRLVDTNGHKSPLIPATFSETINHETAHALKRNKNPRNYFDHKGEMKNKRALGEEARADAVGIRHAPGLYSRNGIVVPEHRFKQAAREAKEMGIGDDTIKQGIAAHQNYWDVHRKVRTTPTGRELKAPGGGKPYVPHFPPTRGFPKLPRIGAMNRDELYGIGAAALAGGIAAHVHRKRKLEALAQKKKFDEAKHRRNRGKFAPTGASVTKSFSDIKRKTTSQLEGLHITPQQARTAGALGQVGGSAGALTGALVGTGIGAIARKPATGAGIGAAIGGSLGGGGGAAAGLYAGRPKKKPVIKSLTDEQKNKAAQAGLAGASVADLVGAKSAFHETRTATKVGTGLKSTLRYAGKKSAFPIVATGLAATALAEHELNRNKPKGPTVIKSADEVFAKAREISKQLERETKHGLKVGAKTGAGVGAVTGAVSGAHLGHALYEGARGAASAGAVGGALRGGVRLGVAGGAIGAGVGALKASKRIKRQSAPVMPQ